MTQLISFADGTSSQQTTAELRTVNGKQWTKDEARNSDPLSRNPKDSQSASYASTIDHRPYLVWHWAQRPGRKNERTTTRPQGCHSDSRFIVMAVLDMAIGLAAIDISMFDCDDIHHAIVPKTHNPNTMLLRIMPTRIRR